MRPQGSHDARPAPHQAGPSYRWVGSSAGSGRAAYLPLARMWAPGEGVYVGGERSTAGVPPCASLRCSPAALPVASPSGALTSRTALSPSTSPGGLGGGGAPTDRLGDVQLVALDLRVKCLQLESFAPGCAPAIVVAGLIALHRMLLSSCGTIADGIAEPEAPGLADLLLLLSSEVMATLARSGLAREAEEVFWLTWRQELTPSRPALATVVASMCGAGRGAEALEICRQLARLPTPASLGAAMGALLAVAVRPHSHVPLAQAYELLASSGRANEPLEAALVRAAVARQDAMVAAALLSDSQGLRLARPLNDEQRGWLVQVATPTEGPGHDAFAAGAPGPALRRA